MIFIVYESTLLFHLLRSYEYFNFLSPLKGFAQCRINFYRSIDFKSLKINFKNTARISTVLVYIKSRNQPNKPILNRQFNKMIIIILKEKSPMNYYMMVSSCHPSYPTRSPCTYIQPTQYTQQILEVLSGALKRSISQYSEIYAQNTCTQSQISLQMQIKSQEQSEKIIPEKQREELLINQQVFQKKQKKIVQENTIILENAAEKQNQNSSQHITDDQIRPQIVEVQNPIKTEETVSTLKKQKIRTKKSHFHVKVPEIDLIQTAYLTNLSISEEEIKKKKENLTQRQVDFWNQKMKNRRDKREIRMLGN